MPYLGLSLSACHMGCERYFALLSHRCQLVALGMVDSLKTFQDSLRTLKGTVPAFTWGGHPNPSSLRWPGFMVGNQGMAEKPEA